MESVIFFFLMESDDIDGSDEEEDEDANEIDNENQTAQPVMTLIITLLTVMLRFKPLQFSSSPLPTVHSNTE